MNLRILNALTEICDLDRPRMPTVDYLVEHYGPNSKAEG